MVDVGTGWIRVEPRRPQLLQIFDQQNASARSSPRVVLIVPSRGRVCNGSEDGSVPVGY